MENKKVILCDTDVMIEFYKGNQQVINEFKHIGQQHIAISIVTAAELIYGALNKKELQKINKDIQHLIVYDIEKGICNSFLEIMNMYVLSHKLAIPDALIAATAMMYNVKLFTYNVKDFKYIKGLTLYTSL